MFTLHWPCNVNSFVADAESLLLLSASTQQLGV
jgi:hypothetical protein